MLDSLKFITTEYAQTLYWCAFGLYLLNIVVGIIAQLKLYHFGKAHHILYFIVFASAIFATLVHFHPALLLTLLALFLMPKSRPWTWKHPFCAALGLLGYVLSFAFNLS
jgi:hypothetical protein